MSKDIEKEVAPVSAKKHSGPVISEFKTLSGSGKSLKEKVHKVGSTFSTESEVAFKNLQNQLKISK